MLLIVLITQRSLVQIQPPQPIAEPVLLIPYSYVDDFPGDGNSVTAARDACQRMNGFIAPLSQRNSRFSMQSFSRKTSVISVERVLG